MEYDFGDLAKPIDKPKSAYDFGDLAAPVAGEKKPEPTGNEKTINAAADLAKGVWETPLALATGVSGGMAGGAVQLATSAYEAGKGLLGGETTPGAAHAVGEYVGGQFTYHPTGIVAQDVVNTLGALSSGFGILPATMAALREQEQKRTGGTFATDVTGGLASMFPKAAGKIAVKAPAAIIRTALPDFILNEGAKGVSWATDLLKNRLEDVKAGRIARDVAGKELPAIKAALAAAGEDVTAAQAAAGVESTTFSALGERAKKGDPQYFKKVGDVQSQANIDELSKISGGRTQTEAKGAAIAGQQALNRVTTPMRDVETNAANIAGKLKTKLEGKAQALADSAANKVEDARRFAGTDQYEIDSVTGKPIIDPTTGNPIIRLSAEQRALDLGRKQLSDKGIPAAPISLTHMGEEGGIADRAQQVASQAAQDSLILGEGARDAQMRADSLAAHGLKPIDTNSLIGKLSAILDDPKYASNDTLHGAVPHVVSEVEKWTAKNGGVIDAEALDSIRKNAVNGFIEKTMGAAEPKAKAKAAAGVMTEIRPLVTKAIVDAGGTGYPEYLATHAKGMEVINRMKLGAKALEMLTESPKAFLKLAKGNDPKTVQKFLDSEYDIVKAMDEKNTILQSVASKVERDVKLKELAKQGSTETERILLKNATRFKIPLFPEFKVGVINKALSGIENALNHKVMKKVYEGMRTGRSALDLMSEMPSSEREVAMKIVKAGQYTAVATAATADEERARRKKERAAK